MEALDLVESIDVAEELVQIEQEVQPDPRAAATYASLLSVHAGLYDALVPAFTQLRRLAPDLPLER
jgi:gluconokinase